MARTPKLERAALDADADAAELFESACAAAGLALRSPMYRAVIFARNDRLRFAVAESRDLSS